MKNQSILKKFPMLALGILLGISFVPRSSAQEEDAVLPATDSLNLVVGDIETVTVNKLNKVSMTNPEIADISDAQGDKVSVLAKKAGETVLYLWDSTGKRTISVRVINEDLGALKARIEKLLDEAGINGISLIENSDIGKVVVSGAVPKDDKPRLEDVLDPYKANLLDLVTEEKDEDLIQVDMEIVEISTSMEKDIGILWGNSSNSGSGNTGTGTGTGTGSTGSGSTPGLITESENLPSTNGNGNVGDFFRVGTLARSPLQATVNAFIQEGKARLISKPRLVVLSGKQASFLVGGEIPTLTTTSNTSGTTLTQNTTYTQYGVNVTVTPTIREGKIDILLNVDIRDIDAANSTVNGTAFITRTASTNLFMDNKQTVALAGLIKYTDNLTVTRVPFLSKIPLLGLLFSNTQTPVPDTNTEMVIILTPTVMTDKKFRNAEVVMPTPAERDSYNEIDQKYEHKPIVSTWTPNTTWGPVKPEVISQDSGPTAVTAYARMVQERISRAITYPSSSTASGTVKLRLSIYKDGTLNTAEVMASSGSAVLDQVALQAARAAAPFSPFSAGMDQEELIFTIPIVYNKLMTASQVSADKVVATY